jgi:DNA polymerase-3 subunit gamma/tau
MKALYRRYRPKTLAEVVGQEQVTSVLQKAIANNKIAHAYLFIGPRGTGKTSVARILAHEINGFDYELEDDYLDIIEIDAASNTGVDNIRDLREKAIIAPTKGKYKVYIIDEVHMLSKSAFNALLKTLEEPPEHVIFIMATTDAYKVPVTITSRSQVLTFKLADPSTMFDYLKSVAKKEKINITDDALKIVVKRGGGSYRDSLSLLEQVASLSEKTITADIITDALGLPQDEAIDRLLFAYKNGNIVEVRDTIAALENQGIKADLVAGELIDAIVDDPEPRLLPLLDRLTKIDPSTSYANVRLLLALTDIPAINSVVASPPPKIQLASTPISKPTITTAPETKPAQQPEEKSEPAPEPKPETTTTPASSSEPIARATNLDENASESEIWNNILAVVAEQAPHIHDWLKSSDGKIEGNTYRIYTRSAFKKKNIEKKRNIIASAIPEQYQLEISEKTLEKDSELAAIADLMGGGEEVEINE